MGIFDEYGSGEVGTATDLQDHAGKPRGAGVFGEYGSRDASIGDDGLYAIDADTFVQNGEKYRLQGVDAREIAKAYDGEWEFGQTGGVEQKDVIVALANKYGYTTAAPVLDAHGNIQRDKTESKRIIGDLVNDRGESFTDKLIREGILGTTRYSSDEQVRAKTGGQLQDAFRDQLIRQGDTSTVTAWDVASADLQNVINSDGLNRKLAPLNEAQFAAAQAASDELGLDNPYSCLLYTSPSPRDS